MTGSSNVGVYSTELAVILQERLSPFLIELLVMFTEAYAPRESLVKNAELALNSVPFTWNSHAPSNVVFDVVVTFIQHTALPVPLVRYVGVISTVFTVTTAANDSDARKTNASTILL